MSNTNNTDDFYTYNDHGTPYEVSAPCDCMYHHGEYAQPVCALDPAITAANRRILAE